MIKRSRNKGFIYGLIDPISKQIRYIGKTYKPLKRRLTEHLIPSSLKANTYKNNWIKKLLKKNYKPIIKLLCICNIKNINKLERKYITLYKNNKLTNLTNGGDGQSIGYKPNKKSIEIVAKCHRIPVIIVNKETEKKRKFKSVKNCAKYLGVAPSSITEVLKGYRFCKSIKGYYVFYANQPIVYPKYQYKLIYRAISLDGSKEIKKFLYKDFKKYGFISNGGVYNVIKGHRLHYKGFVIDVITN